MTLPRTSVILKLMEITVRIPDELATHLGAIGEVERRVLETIALEEFKLGI